MADPNAKLTKMSTTPNPDIDGEYYMTIFFTMDDDPLNEIAWNSDSFSPWDDWYTQFQASPVGADVTFPPITR